MRRIKTLVGFALLTVAVMLTSFSGRNQTLAGDFSCRLSPACAGVAQCSGDRWTRTGDCSISCYKEAGAPGEIVFTSSANCGTGAGGRPMGDFPGSN